MMRDLGDGFITAIHVHQSQYPVSGAFSCVALPRVKACKEEQVFNVLCSPGGRLSLNAGRAASAFKKPYHVLAACTAAPLNAEQSVNGRASDLQTHNGRTQA